jgi:hypothetical protein
MTKLCNDETKPNDEAKHEFCRRLEYWYSLRALAMAFNGGLDAFEQDSEH